MKKEGGTWTPEHIFEFIRAPQKVIPGTAMTFAGISRASERADVVAYLNTLSDNPKPLKAEIQSAPKKAEQGAPKKAEGSSPKSEPAAKK
jgi:cytochrome c